MLWDLNRSKSALLQIELHLGSPICAKISGQMGFVVGKAQLNSLDKGN
jgi:hypothetical protein